MTVKYYVTMTDKFMSGWGQAAGKKNKLVFECESMKDAQTVADNARKRGDQIYINITSKKPSYPSSRYYTQFKNKEEYPKWYEENAF